MEKKLSTDRTPDNIARGLALHEQEHLDEIAARAASWGGGGGLLQKDLFSRR